MNPEEVNLRPAVDPTQSCQTCGNWQQGVCSVLQVPTEPTMVCDAYAAIQADPEALSAKLFGGPNVAGLQ